MCSCMIGLLAAGRLQIAAFRWWLCTISSTDVPPKAVLLALNLRWKNRARRKGPTPKKLGIAQKAKQDTLQGTEI